MTERDDIDLTAAEYVLGTLELSARATIEARRASEPALDNAIIAWQRRLAPLDTATPEVTPPAGLLAEIERRIADGVSSGDRTGLPPGKWRAFLIE